MPSVNRVILVGNLGKDPESRALPNGGIVSNFTLATNRRWKDPAGTLHDEAEWHSLAAFGRTAELARDYLKKGRSVYVEGRIKTHDWEDKEGKKHYRTEIVVDHLQFLGPGRAANDSGDAPRRADEDTAAAPAPLSAAAPPAMAKAAQRMRPTGKEDLPF